MASLVALLEAATTPWRREWDAASGGHHVNLLSGRRYRGANPALLTLGMHLRGSALPYWCGFAEAKALGIFPRKGSKAVHVLRPQVHQGGEGRLAESGSAAEGGHGSAGADGQPSFQPGRSWVSYRSVALFNAADLEGEALEALIQIRRGSASRAAIDSMLPPSCSDWRLFPSSKTTVATPSMTSAARSISSIAAIIQALRKW